MKEEVAPAAIQKEELAKLTDFLATSTGVKADNIVFDAAHKTFVLDGDVLITETDARERMAAGQAPQGEHWRGNYLVSNTYVTNIDYFIESSVSSAWRTATRQGIANWNAVNGTRLFLRETTTRSQADVIVNTSYADANWIAQAYLPYSNGRPGNTVTINTKYNSLDASRKQFAMTHEMGHIHGLLHTNQTQGVFIPGTPSSDPNSVMNASVLAWQGFTAGDILATQIIYPE
ncbi:zinc-dependent metalloprotease [Hymenobacter weizhouensis]|uniref:zinc-dependent metalloprotease n=1 Tax=Hymenobacter sp. YIM 151500-1 TaxID=2987689 RepID=UPI00222727DD|nr:zinc-dependent metalloprotease [Hymenobacter sp. YIM 151500-1]UYZ63683.1 zinc-dependent metalloprotease [Hymenobacter sp. YIM 151500-1]